MRGIFWRAAWVLAIVVSASARPATADERPSRTFDFEYSAAVTSVPKGARIKMWVPIAQTTPDQQVEVKSVPADGRFTREATYGNRLLFLQRIADGEDTAVRVTYRVTRFEDHGKPQAAAGEVDNSRYLQPDNLVPVGGKAKALIAGKTLPADDVQRAKLIYDAVDDHMVYRKDRPGWGTGNSEWAYESCFGNCTDFHSLFISLARAEHLPAKFEIGFMLGSAANGTVAGYHCWAKFKPAERGWVPVDISDANQHPEKREANFGAIDANRIMLTTGRDLVLVPRQAGGPVNFLVYPYVEVDGKPVPQEQIKKSFAYRDESRAMVEE